jgi:HEAT repeat protein
MIRFSCPQCETNLKAPEDRGGTKITCPECGERVKVPAESANGDEGPKSDPKISRSGKTATLAKKTGKSSGSSEKSNMAIIIGVGAAACVLVAGVGIYFGTDWFKSEDKPKPSGSDSSVASSSSSGLGNTGGGILGGSSNTGSSLPAFPGTTATTPVATPKEPKTVETKAPDSVGGTKDTGDLPQLSSLEAEEVYKRVLKSTVFITTLMPEGIIMGSGSLIDREHKLVLTNHHVIEDAKKGYLSVMFPEYVRNELIVEKDQYIKKIRKKEGIPCWVKYDDSKRDLAIIQLAEIPDGAQTLRLARNSVRPGQRVHSVGNPGASGALWVYSPGSVRAVYHKDWVAGNSPTDLQRLSARIVETNSPVNPGDSGGPMVNDQKELVAVTQGGSRTASLVNFFIDISEVRTVLAAHYKKEGIKSPLEAGPTRDESTDITKLIKALESPETSKRAGAAVVLGQIGPDARAAVSTLMKTLKDPDDTVRKNSAEALEQIGSLTQSHLGALIEVLTSDSNGEVRLAVVSVIKRMGTEGETAVPALIKVLEDKEAAVRQKAATTLGTLGPVAKTAVAPLAKALKDENSGVRAEAAFALSKMGSEALPALEQLGEALKDIQEVRLNALAAIEALGSDAKSLMPLLIKTLVEKDKETRLKAIAAVGAIGPDAKDAIPNLISLLESKDFTTSAGEALVKIGKVAVTPLMNALKHPKWEARLGAVKSLGLFGSDAKRALVMLNLMATRDSNSDVRKACLEAIKRINK